MNESIVGCCLILVTLITCNGQDIQPAKPVGSTNIPHAAYVDRLLAGGREIVPYADQKALNSADIGMLVKRYHEIPSVTNKWGITAALAYRGDERVLELFWNTLTLEYAGRQFLDSRQETSEAMQLATMMSFLGYQAARSEKAFDLLKDGIKPTFWETNVTWSVHGQPASYYLVGASIKGLAWSGRDDAWQVVLDLKTKGDAGYLKQYSGAIVDAAFCRYLIVNGKVGQSANKNPLADLVAWQESTPDGRAWQQWHDKIMVIDENMMWHRPKNSPAPVAPVVK
jgi:hypothetical protein